MKGSSGIQDNGFYGISDCGSDGIPDWDFDGITGKDSDRIAWDSFVISDKISNVILDLGSDGIPDEVLLGSLLRFCWGIRFSVDGFPDVGLLGFLMQSSDGFPDIVSKIIPDEGYEGSNMEIPMVST